MNQILEFFQGCMIDWLCSHECLYGTTSNIVIYVGEHCGVLYGSRVKYSEHLEETNFKEQEVVPTWIFSGLYQGENIFVIIKYPWMRHCIRETFSNEWDTLEKTYNSFVFPLFSSKWYHVFNLLDMIYSTNTLYTSMYNIPGIVGTVFCLVPTGYLTVVACEKNDSKIIVPNLLRHENES